MYYKITKDETRKRKSPEKKRNRESAPEGGSTPDENKLRRPCKVCSETTHITLLGCSNFKRYLPGQPEGTSSLPKEVC